MAMLVLLLLLALLLPPSAAPTLVEIQIDAGGLPAHTVDERFVSVTLDEIELGNGFNGTRFESPVLQKCTRALAPAYLRIGGFSEDFTKYRGSTPPPLPPPPPPPFLRGEAPVGPTTYAFNLSAWRKVNRFAASAKLDIVFGLNALTARADTESPWDPSLSGEDQLINYTLRQSYEDFPVAGWELSNELDIKNRPPTPRLVRPSRLAADFLLLRQLLNRSALSQHPSRNTITNGAPPRIFGPDTATIGAIGGTEGPHAVYHHYFSQFAGNLSAGVVDELTFHQYYFRGPGARAEQFISAATLDSLRPEIEEAVGTAAAAAAISHGAALGETASSFAGGTPGLSDSFASTFGWVDKLGLSASLGLRRVFRQDLVSANAYTLFDLRDGADEVPTPDYYASLLWRRLMGTRVLRTRSLGLPKLRAYAHCARATAQHQSHGATQAISLALINLNSGPTGNVSAAVNISGLAAVPASAEDAVEVYVLTPGGGNFTSHTAVLNGAELRPQASGEPPELLPVRQRVSTPIAVPALSVAFVVFPGAAAACQASEQL